MFKMFMLLQISNNWLTIEEILKHYFVRSKLAIENTTTYIESVFIFLIMQHVFTCAWIWIGNNGNGWMGDDADLYYDN